jgi:hypothetical protein
MRRFVCLVALCLAGPAAAATCAPDKLVHVVASDVTPGVDPRSFAAQPKSFYRIGDDRVRTEEDVDAVNRIHGLIVIAEPNIWMVNLYDRSGQHIVDPGPTFFAHAPVFALDGVSAKLMALEFGCEGGFIAANAPAAVRTERVGGRSYEVHRIEDGADAAEILEQSGASTPAFARYYHGVKLVFAVRYDLYMTGLPNDPALFTAPADIRYQEQQQGSH